LINSNFYLILLLLVIILVIKIASYDIFTPFGRLVIGIHPICWESTSGSSRLAFFSEKMGAMIASGDIIYIGRLVLEIQRISWESTSGSTRNAIVFEKKRRRLHILRAKWVFVSNLGRLLGPRNYMEGFGNL